MPADDQGNDKRCRMARSWQGASGAGTSHIASSQGASWQERAVVLRARRHGRDWHQGRHVETYWECMLRPDLHWLPAVLGTLWESAFCASIHPCARGITELTEAT